MATAEQRLKKLEKIVKALAKRAFREPELSKLLGGKAADDKAGDDDNGEQGSAGGTD